MANCNREASIKNEIAAIQIGQKNETTVTNYLQKISELEGLVKAGCFSPSNSNDAIINKEKEIIELKKKISDKEHDIDVAKSRHKAIIESEKKPSYYQGISARLGFTKPFKRPSVAILIALGIFLTLMSLYIGKSFFGSGSSDDYGLNVDSGTFDQKAFIYGVLFVAVIVGILSYLGYYGKAPN